MRTIRKSGLLTLILSIFAVLMFSSFCMAAGAPESDDLSGDVKSKASQEADQEVLDKLKKMSPEELEALDKRLAEALVLFYDNENARALTIFREVAGTAETMDIMFWTATSAFRAGDADLAIAKYQQMLGVDPNLHRVRLELATVYFKTKKYNQARQQLKTVMAADPPEAVRANIDKLAAAIDARTKKLFHNFRFAQSLQWDSNVSAGPDIQAFRDFFGAGATPGNPPVGSWVSVTSLAGNLLYDAGDKNGLLWNNTVSLYSATNTDYRQYDFSNVKGTAGPWWVWEDKVVKLPIGYARNIYDYSPLYDTRDISPSFEYYYSKKLSMAAKYSYSDDSYDAASDKTKNSTGHRLEIAPTFYLNKGSDMLTLSYANARRDAKNEMYSYDGFDIAVSYLKSLRWDMELFGRYMYSKRDYKAPGGVLWTANRSDTLRNLYLLVNKNYGKNLFASIYWNWVDNGSNEVPYVFDKSIVGLSVGFKL